MLYCADKQHIFYRRIYTSRWKLILQDYSTLHAHIYNSLDLLRGTNLALYAINKVTLVSHNIFVRLKLLWFIAKVVQEYREKEGDSGTHAGFGAVSSTSVCWRGSSSNIHVVPQVPCSLTYWLLTIVTCAPLKQQTGNWSIYMISKAVIITLPFYFSRTRNTGSGSS